MLKGVLKFFNSARVLLCLALLTTLLFLFHFVKFSSVLEGGTEGASVSDNLRSQQLIRTITEKLNELETLTKHAHPTADATIERPPSQPVRQVNSVESKTISVEPVSSQAKALPGGADHPILQLSDAQFKSTPVSEMFKWYGQANGGGSCAQDFGYELIEKWRGEKKTYCKQTTAPTANKDTNNKNSGSLGSSIDCYLTHQTRHHGNGDNLCVMRNVAVDVALFGDDSRTRSVIQRYVDTRHNQQPYIKFPKGFIEGDCSPDPTLWQAINMPGWNADLTVGAFRSTAGAADTAAVCEEWVAHPVLLTQRDTFANFFHDSEDFFNVFIAMAVLQYSPAEVQMYLTDLYPEGPFWDIWSKAYSQGDTTPTNTGGNTVKGAMQTRTAWDLRQAFAHIPKGKKVCFKELAIGIYGPAAPITVASWDTPCSRTALVRAYSDFIIRGLGLRDSTHYALPGPSRTITITYMSRRPSKEWPERKYCDSSRSFFLCELWAHFGERQLGRMIRNDQEVVAALKTLESKGFANADRIVVNDVDYNVLSFDQQIRTDLSTDVMIGPHGAGLMHNIFMRDRAWLIELFVDGSSVNRHFHNLAHWFGRPYKGVPTSNPINIAELLREVESAVRSIDTAKY